MLKSRRQSSYARSQSQQGGKDMKKLLLVVLAVASLGIYGCSGDSTNIANPSTNPNTLTPTGTIQGVLTDAISQQPIVGAVVDIGVGRATTSSSGQYVISNVPANTDSVAGVELVRGTYTATVDLTNVKVTAGSSLYPQYSYSTVSVTFTSLNDSNPGSGSSPGSTSGSNHATPVTGLVANMNLIVGKLGAGITGQVVLNTLNGEGGLTGAPLKPVGAGYNVALYLGNPNFSKQVASATTDANGLFSVTNLQAGQTYNVMVGNSDGSVSNAKLTPLRTLTTMAENTTSYFTLASGAPISVVKNDGANTVVKSVSVAKFSTVPVGSQDVVFTFSQPVAKSAYALATTQTAATTVALWNDVAVNFVGYKVSNIAHSLAWSTDMTQLTVTIPTLGVSSIYSVDISAALANLKNANGTVFTDPYGVASTTFYTAGGAVSAKPVVQITNADTIDYSSVVLLSWNAAQNAKKYNIYRAKTQVFGLLSSARNQYSKELVGTTINTTFEDLPPSYTDTIPPVKIPNPLSFVENGTVKLTYSYQVAGVNSDGVEGPLSDVVTASDKVKPKVVSYTTTVPGGCPSGNANCIAFLFNEPMNSTLVKTAANFRFQNYTSYYTPPVLSNATYSTSAYQVVFDMDKALTNTTDGKTGPNFRNPFLQILLVTDVAGNLIDAKGNTLNY
jgi:hypothetical protein